MDKNIKKYKVGIDSETYAVSLVEQPAIDETFVYMADEEKMNIMLDSDEKYLVYGAVLVPDKPIYRVAEDGTEFYLEFTAESIEKMSQDYLIKYRQHAVTLDHQEEATEVCMVESWIKTSMTMDKSLALGLNPELPIGTWFAGYKINNIDTWNRIKSGELRGFSVEAMIDLQQFDFAKNIEEMSINEMKESGLFEEMKRAFKEAMKEEKLASEENLTPSEKEVKKELENIDENITVAEVKLEDETATATETVTETPTVTEPIVENPTIETPAETPTIETPAEEPKPVEEQKVEEHNPMADVVANLQTELETLRKMNEDLMAKVADLNKQPSAKPINTNTPGVNGGNTNFQNWREQMKRYL